MRDLSDEVKNVATFMVVLLDLVLIGVAVWAVLTFLVPVAILYLALG